MWGICWRITVYVSYEDIKKVVADLKKIHTTVTLDRRKKICGSLELLGGSGILLCQKLGGQLGGSVYLFRISAGDSVNHIHDEYHGGPEPAAPPDHQE